MKGPFRKNIPRCVTFTFIVCALFWLPTVSAHAGGDEETVARNFLSYVGSAKAILSSEVIEVSLLDSTLSPVVAGYLFHLQDGGYLLVSGDRTISPVKAYSLAGDFASLPEPYRKALLSELELRVRVAKEAAVGRTPLDAGMSETEARWNFLLGLTAGGRMPLAYAAGTNLIQTKWNQGYPYNKFLPAVGGQTVWAGCVNIALAQVMRYHKYPASGKGVLSYDWDGQTLKTILYRIYNWDNMPATVAGDTPEYQADEVALLIRDLGIANETSFGVDGSGASFNTRMLLENFGYSTSVSHMSNDSFEPFLATIKSEIEAERPVLLSVPGHMVVADGYSADNDGRKIHLNMGWGGTADNFYFLDETIAAGGYNFTTNAGDLGIYYSIKPCSGGDCTINLEEGDAINGLAIAGSFDQANDKDVYEIYLKGATTISATRGLGNLYFYPSVVNLADGNIVANPGYSTRAGVIFDGSLAAGKYAVRVSLCAAIEGGTSCMSLMDGYNQYTVTLTSEALTADEKAAVDLGLAQPPVIGNVFPDLILGTASGTRKILIDVRDERGDAVTLQVKSSNPAAVTASLNGNILDLTPAGPARVSSRIVVTAAANGKTTEKAFTVMTDDSETAFGKSFSVAGTFTSQSDVKTHRAILDGACTITGDNGFSNQGFYSSVLTAAGSELVPATDGPINQTFSRGIHLLRASLTGSGGWHYDYVAGSGDRYTLTVSCPNADESTQTIAGILGIDLSGADRITGDIGGDGSVTLADAILTLQILSGFDTTGKTIKPANEVSGDQRVGLAEAIFVMQAISGLRNP